jgi:hypothetical protein
MTTKHVAEFEAVVNAVLGRPSHSHCVQCEPRQQRGSRRTMGVAGVIAARSTPRRTKFDQFGCGLSRQQAARILSVFGRERLPGSGASTLEPQCTAYSS